MTLEQRLADAVARNDFCAMTAVAHEVRALPVGQLRERLEHQLAQAVFGR